MTVGDNVDGPKLLRKTIHSYYIAKKDQGDVQKTSFWNRNLPISIEPTLHYRINLHISLEVQLPTMVYLCALRDDAEVTLRKGMQIAGKILVLHPRIPPLAL